MKSPSRRCPHHSSISLQSAIQYGYAGRVVCERPGFSIAHLPAVGGLRKPRRIRSTTDGATPVFAGTPTICRRTEFSNALEELMALWPAEPTAIMCAEAVPWRCHRSLIADALVTRGWEVRHIMSPETSHPHILTSFAHLREGKADLSETDRSPFVVLTECADVPTPGRSGSGCSPGVCGLRPVRRATCAEVAVDRMAAPAGGCCGARSSNSPAGSARSRRWRIGCARRVARPPIIPTSSHSICCRCSTLGT